MDRNTVIGFVLLGALFIGYLTIQSNISQKARVQEAMRQDSIRVANELRIADSLEVIKKQKIAWVKANADSTILADSLSDADLLNLYTKLNTAVTDTLSPIIENSGPQYSGPFADALQGENATYTLENDKLKITFTGKGGDIQRVQLKEYKNYDGGPLMLVDGNQNHFNYTFYYDNDKLLNTDSLFFTVYENIPSKSITFRASAGEGKYFDQVYVFNDTSYLVDYSIRLTGFNTVIPANLAFLKLNWQNDMQEQEKNIKYERQYSKFYFSYKNEDIDYKSTNGKIDFDASVKWLSCQQQFFNTTLIAKTGFDNQGSMNIYSDDTSAFVKRCSSELFITFNNQAQFDMPMQWYFAPNSYNALKDLGIGLETIVPTGTSIFRVINRWVIIPLFNFLGGFLSNYGLIILLMTLIIKLALTPLTYRSYLSMAKMRVLQPEIAEMKEKFKDDQAKMGQEQLKLFRKAGVNPLGGCIPTLLSMPILIALFRFFPGSIELRQQSFLWADDLSSYDDIIHWGADIPFIGNHLSIFCVLMTLSSILYMRMNMTQASGLTKEMRWVQYMMPVFFLFFLNSSPAGLTYYYFVSNMVTFGQQWGIRRFLINDETIHAQIQENKTKPVKKSKFAQRLEEAMKQQEAMRRGKKK